MRRVQTTQQGKSAGTPAVGYDERRRRSRSDGRPQRTAPAGGRGRAAATPRAGPHPRRRGRAQRSVGPVPQPDRERARASQPELLEKLADALRTTAVELLAAADPACSVDVVRAEGMEEWAEPRVRSLVRGHHQMHAQEFTGDHDAGRELQFRNDQLMYVAEGAVEIEAEGAPTASDAATPCTSPAAYGTAGGPRCRRPGCWSSPSPSTSRRCGTPSRADEHPARGVPRPRSPRRWRCRRPAR